MKKYDVNSFVIDHVFARIDKLYKKAEKKKKEKLMDEEMDLPFEHPVEEINEIIKTEKEPVSNDSDDEYYRIVINV